MARPKTSTPSYGRIRSASELGELCREERKRRGLTLADVYEATNLSTRFLSEFERGKEHASVGRALRTLESLGLDVLVVPRAETETLLRDRAARHPDAGHAASARLEAASPGPGGNAADPPGPTGPR